jgi:hypothetical protein
VWLPTLRRLEFRPEGYEQQRAMGRDPTHYPTDQFEAGWVGPMRILEDHQHGTFAGKRLDLSKSAFAQRSYECIYVSFDTPQGGT